MTLYTKYFPLWSLILLFLSCAQTDETFVKDMISTYKNESINRNHIDWQNFEREVLKSLKISQDSAIATALKLNNNPHSYFISKKKLYQINSVNALSSCTLHQAIDLKKFEGFGYIKLKGFFNNPYDQGHDKDNSTAYIKKIHQTIAKLDQPGLKGWIIDLRYNYGGDMWPMLIALSPFFEEGNLGFFQIETKKQDWSFKNNIIYLDNQSQNERVYSGKSLYRAVKQKTKVAVLINHQTKSSGEAVAIALRTLKNVKFFGAKTRGFATSNHSFNFGSRGTLVLTTGFMHDYKGLKFDDGINPDLTVCNHIELEQYLSDWLLTDN